MADNVAITAGSGTNVAADERTINSTTVQVQRVTDIGATAIATNQVAPTASSASLVSARETRNVLTIFNGTNMTVYLGVTGHTTGNGFELQPGAGLSLRTTAQIFQIVSTVTGLTGTVSYIESYDS